MMDNAMRWRIDGLTRFDMARIWRFAPSGDPMLQGEAGDYFKQRFFGDFGGFSPAISRSLGWGD